MEVVPNYVSTVYEKILCQRYEYMKRCSVKDMSIWRDAVSKIRVYEKMQCQRYEYMKRYCVKDTSIWRDAVSKIPVLYSVHIWRDAVSKDSLSYAVWIIPSHVAFLFIRQKKYVDPRHWVQVECCLGKCWVKQSAVYDIDMLSAVLKSTDSSKHKDVIPTRTIYLILFNNVPTPV